MHFSRTLGFLALCLSSISFADYSSSRSIPQQGNSGYSSSGSIPQNNYPPFNSNSGYSSSGSIPQRGFGPYEPNHGRYDWVNAIQGDLVPRDAFIGGRQPGPPFTLFVCRAHYRNGMHPGKLIDGHCNIAWGGREVERPQYQVLVSQAPLRWLASSYGFIPPNAVAGGFENGKTLYVCQAPYQGGMHPGKIVGRDCHIGWGGREVAIPYYNVLIRS